MSKLKLIAKQVFLFFILIFSSSMKAQLLDSLELARADIYESLEEALRTPEKIYRLDLSKQKLTSFPKEIFQLKYLQELNLSKNKLTELPENIDSLQYLQVLNVSKNNLESLPKNIGKLVHLKKLHAGQNELIAIPNMIGYCESLEVLDLWSNNLSFFPEELSMLKNLRVMDLRVIQIKEEEQNRIKKLLPNTLIKFTPDCRCGG